MRNITIQGVEFEISEPYAEGHTCTEAEAKALNQTRSEAIRNNNAKRIKDAKEAHGDELPANILTELADAISTYDKEYEFTLASVGGGRVSRDPVEVEARKIARTSIIAQLKTDNRTLKSVTDVEGGKEKLEAAIAQVAASDAVVKAAKKAVADRAKLAETGIGSLDL